MKIKIYETVTDNKYVIKFTVDNQTFSLYPIEKDKKLLRFYKKNLRIALTRLQNYYIMDNIYDL